MKRAILSFIAGSFFVISSSSSLGFSTHNTTISRVFDKEQAVIGDTIRVTVSFNNEEANDLHGFYFTEQVPDGLALETISVNIAGNSLSNYVVDIGTSGDIYTGFIPYRWVLEVPSDFSCNNPIPENSIVNIFYDITSLQVGNFNFDEYSWVGYYQTAPEGEQAVFGYSEDADRQIIKFTTTLMAGDVDGSGTLDLQDAVLICAVLAGVPHGSIIYTQADVDGDAKIGLPEIIYVLQRIAGIR